jgi:hypothetical protein
MHDAAQPAPVPPPCLATSAAYRLFHPDPDEDSHWSWFSREFGGELPEYAAPLESILADARELGCRTVVLEERYVDIDYRSEFSEFWSRRFEDAPPLARRVHFFTRRLKAESLHRLDSDVDYLGYMVLRRTQFGPVGRTVLRPPPRVGEEAVLCSVEDRVSLFGNELRVRGAPFVQQDTEFLRCAHAAAWGCHYVAHHRKLIGRRTTAEIARLPSPEGSRHRPLPSNGLTGEQMQKIFSAIGLPAFFYDAQDLPDPPADLPGPTGEKLGLLAGRAAKQNAAQRARQCWERDMKRERLLRIACKYINSGFPVVVLTSDEEPHAFTLVGWERTGDGVRLYACDDTVGPYVPIDDVLAEQAEHGDWVGLMLPLPEKVLLTGEAAEQHAWRAAEGASRAEGPVSAQETDFAALTDKLAHLRAGLSMRSVLIEGRELKARLGSLGRDGDALALYRLAHLPHWVWLVEFHDPLSRERGDPCVVAEMVIDSSSHDESPQLLLSMTASEARDHGAIRRDDPGPTTAPGPGERWNSVILHRVHNASVEAEREVGYS